jgi:hypothetical protein
VWPLPPEHCRCRWWLLRLSNSVTHVLRRAPQDEGSALVETSDNTQHSQKTDTSMPPAGFDPAVQASERLLTYLRLRLRRHV